MSYEAWGDDDDGMDRVYEQLLDAGWLTSEDARDLRGKLLALSWERMVLMAAYDLPLPERERAFSKAMLYSEASCIEY